MWKVNELRTTDDEWHTTKDRRQVMTKAHFAFDKVS